MAYEPRWSGEDRRTSPRIAGQGSLSAAVMDQYGQPRSILKQAQAVNISGGGLAFTSANTADVGETVNIRTEDPQGKPFRVRIVGANRRGDGRSELRAELIEGSIPASLMYGW